MQTKELCVHDICVTRDQFAEVFGSPQSAAAAGTATAGLVETAGALGGSSTPYGESADTTTVTEDGGNGATTTPAIDEEAADMPAVSANDEDDAQQDAGDPEPQPDVIAPPHVSPPSTEDAAHVGSTPSASKPVPAGTPATDNPDLNSSADPLPAIGTE